MRGMPRPTIYAEAAAARARVRSAHCGCGCGCLPRRQGVAAQWLLRRGGSHCQSQPADSSQQFCMQARCWARKGKGARGRGRAHGKNRVGECTARWVQGSSSRKRRRSFGFCAKLSRSSCRRPAKREAARAHASAGCNTQVHSPRPIRPPLWAVKFSWRGVRARAHGPE